MPVLLIVIYKAEIPGESHSDVIVVVGVGEDIMVEQEGVGLDVVQFVVSKCCEQMVGRSGIEVCTLT